MSVPIMPATINFKQIDGNAILKGSDWYIEISIANREGSIDTPVNLTGFTGTCQIRVDANSDAIIAEPVVDIVNPEGGSLSLSLDKEITKDIPSSGKTYKDKTQYQYDVVIDNKNSGETYRILQGYVDVSPNITKEVI